MKEEKRKCKDNFLKMNKFDEQLKTILTKNISQRIF